MNGLTQEHFDGVMDRVFKKFDEVNDKITNIKVEIGKHDVKIVNNAHDIDRIGNKVEKVKTELGVDIEDKVDKDAFIAIKENSETRTRYVKYTSYIISLLMIVITFASLWKGFVV